MNERYHCLEDLCDSRGGHECEVCEDAFNRGRASAFVERKIKELEKYDKYRWHDLRKDPEDLPKDEKTVLCLWSGTAYGYDFPMSPHTMFLSNDGEWTFANTGDIQSDANISGYDGKVIAWREIEPFTDDYIMPENSDHRKQRGRTAPNEEER